MSSDLYSGLPDEAKEIIGQVQNHFADLFDNETGGPFLGEISDTFTEERYGLFVQTAIDRINIRLVSTGGGSFTPVDFPYGVPVADAALRTGITVEAIKHFKLSFVEYPDWGKVNSPTIDRRDYLNRWDNVLKEWESMFQDSMKGLANQISMGMSMMGGTSVLLDPNSMFWGGGTRSYGGITPPWWFGN